LLDGSFITHDNFSAKFTTQLFACVEHFSVGGDENTKLFVGRKNIQGIIFVLPRPRCIAKDNPLYFAQTLSFFVGGNESLRYQILASLSCSSRIAACLRFVLRMFRELEPDHAVRVPFLKLIHGR
jgi:hypothetical protein